MMRWTFRICLLLLAAWIVYAASPYVALYGLSRAVERRDADAIAQHINFRAFRLSLTKQLVGEYLDRTNRTRDLSAFDKKLASEAGATVADPIVAQLLTPATLVDLLNDGWPQEVLQEAPDGPAPAPAPALGPAFSSIGKALRLYASSEAHGFRTMIFTVPVDAAPQDRYRLQMRLSGFRWRLSGVDLPASLLEKLADRIPHR
ncbi:DUF2939 domain-containing protein [Microvirga pudoricolor]|uniref:DUF2939 domain-containing protein n=1 Tax=Microvirga pudoricolor TaxID=2778729 RepID=UPI0019507031|nr:DUF2939 domain-containing protein [Microvirga pudoricolor]MBM6592398.1 DUF2939 domain-containing protein [Microvirga pudoricolor]